MGQCDQLLKHASQLRAICRFSHTQLARPSLPPRLPMLRLVAVATARSVDVAEGAVVALAAVAAAGLLKVAKKVLLRASRRASAATAAAVEMGVAVGAGASTTGAMAPAVGEFRTR